MRIRILISGSDVEAKVLKEKLAPKLLELLVKTKKLGRCGMPERVLLDVKASNTECIVIDVDDGIKKAGALIEITRFSCENENLTTEIVDFIRESIECSNIAASIISCNGQEIR